MEDKRPRVIVGVRDSLAGLRALRRAVAEARSRDAVLHALRAWTAPSAGYTSLPRTWVPDFDDIALEEIRHSFDAAMGELPRDIDLRFVRVQGLAGPALVEYAHRDDDLLVVGIGRHNLAGRLFSRRVAAYCLRKAVCPVLVVPPDAFATAMSGRASIRQLTEEACRLTEARPRPGPA
jgi:nucleotide-binding universal stress UspA family protein